MRNRLISIIIQGAFWVLALIHIASQGFQNAPQAALQQAAKEDHAQMMEQLHITSLRPGVNARVLGSANYDEAKANPYPDLPDPLKMKNGKKVTSAKMWWDRRRPEIVEDFDREVYGRVPNDVPKVKWEVTNTADEHVGDVPIITKTLVGHVDNSADAEITVDIQLSLSTPADSTGPVPVIMVFGGPPAFGSGGPPAVAASQQYCQARW